MKHTLILFSLCILFLGCTKDWGNPTTKNYPINATYSGIEVSSAFQVTMSEQVTDVVITVGDLAHEIVEVKVKDGKLHIGLKPSLFNNYDGMATAIIPFSIIRDLELSGASSFTGNLSGEDVDIDLSGASVFRGNVTADELDIDLSGSSSYTGNIITDKLDFNLSGSSPATIGGSCQNTMEITLSGASRLNAANFYTDIVRGSMSGGSFANVSCCSSLNVELSGGSTLIYGTHSEDCHPVINCPSSGGSTVSPRL